MDFLWIITMSKPIAVSVVPLVRSKDGLEGDD